VVIFEDEMIVPILIWWRRSCRWSRGASKLALKKLKGGMFYMKEIYIYIYVCVCVCVCGGGGVCVCVCVCVWWCVCVCVWWCVCVWGGEYILMFKSWHSIIFIKKIIRCDLTSCGRLVSWF
jgi:hypothetical protein